jgi:LuxR family maltose regulon positive regulatory protein
VILQETESALEAGKLPDAELDDAARDLIGKIAAARANLAQTQAEAEIILAHARRALEYLNPDNLSDRSMATRTMGFAYYLQSDLAKAGQAYEEALSLAQSADDSINSTLVSIRLGQIQEEKNQLHLAAATYQQVIQIVNDYSPSNASVAYLGLARVFYEWNDLSTAERYGEQSFRLAQQYDQVIDRIILSEMFMARLKLAQGDAPGAADILSHVEQTAYQKHYTFREPFIAYDQAFVLLRQGNTEAALQLTKQNDLPLMKARVLIARKNPAEALQVLEELRQEAAVKGWPNRLLMVMAVLSMALYALNEKAQAVDLVGKVLTQAEPEGFIRLFLDEGEAMEELLSAAATQGIRPRYINRLLCAFEAEPKKESFALPGMHLTPRESAMVEPLSPREQEVLRLIAQGLSNRQISERLYLALDTIKGHNRIIFDKLQVQSRTEAVARAQQLGLL